MEPSNEGAAHQKQPEAENPEESKKSLVAEAGQHQTPPSPNRGGNGDDNQRPPHNALPRKYWCRRLKLTDRITAISALISAIATVVIMIWAGLQWKEMDDAGKQTDRLICLYGQQVTQMSKQAGDTHDLAVAAKAQSEQTKMIASQAIIQANAAKSDADTAASQLELAERPWVELRNIRIAETPQISVNGLSIVIAYDVAVTGNSPAQDLNVVSAFYVTCRSTDRVVEQEAALRGRLTTMVGNTTFGASIFPSQPIPKGNIFLGPQSITIPSTDLRDCIPNLPGEPGSITILLGAGYRTAFSTKIYHTIYALDIQNGGRPNYGLTLRDIEEGNARLACHITNCTSAD